MSHITTAEVQVSDIDSFDAACKALGLELRRDQKTFRNYGGRKTPCDMAIVWAGNKEAYEAGLVKRPDGKYEVQCDNFDAYTASSKALSLNSVIGNNAGLLLQRYGLNVARKAAAKQGMSVREVKQTDGSIKLVCEPRQLGQFVGSGF